MSKTIIINMPARTVTMRTGKKTFPAYAEKLTQDEAGQWFADLAGNPEKISETEAIDVCRKGVNWTALRSAHFPMFGFHN